MLTLLLLCPEIILLLTSCVEVEKEARFELLLIASF